MRSARGTIYLGSNTVKILTVKCGYRRGIQPGVRVPPGVSVPLGVREDILGVFKIKEDKYIIS
jgi:hypothetical protein